MFAMAKRVVLFLLVNFLVVLTISIVLRVLGVQPYLTYQGIDYSQLMIFCLIWGMGGAFISLGLSRVIAKWSMGVRVIEPGTRDSEAQALVATVHELARGAGLRTMPEVGIYDSPEVNAFATGPTRNRALVAVSTGLLRRMGREEIEGVLGHELSHVANGDMVTMTLIQGVVNAFVMFFARVIAFALAQAMRDERDDRPSYGMQYMATFLLEIVFGILGMMVVAWFSRWREFRADAGGARLAGRGSMVGALQAQQRTYGLVDESHAQPALAALKINGRPAGFARLFSTHPPLGERIERLLASG
jgi:heat shock protein HtpX